MAFTAHLIMRDVPMEFYKSAFGATEMYRMETVGRVGHALLMRSDEFPEMEVLGPESRGGSAVEAFFARAGGDGDASGGRPVLW